MKTKAYEIRNPSINGMTLYEQIEHGCNDWAAEDEQGRVFVGETAAKAEANRDNYKGK